MPDERREICFAEPDVTAAALAYLRRRGDRLPAEGPRAVRLAADPAAFLTLEFAPPEAGTEGPMVSLSEAELGAALILYCRANAIPLPRAGRKSLRPNGTAVTLAIRLSDRAGEEAAAGPPEAEAAAPRPEKGPAGG